jgi:hypothetical protein
MDQDRKHEAELIDLAVRIKAAEKLFAKQKARVDRLRARLGEDVFSASPRSTSILSLAARQNPWSDPTRDARCQDARRTHSR